MLHPVRLKLNDLITNSERMFRLIMGDNIQFTLTLEENLWDIYGDSNQIIEVIMNLLVNARDAMPHGGNLTLETKNISLDEHPELLDIQSASQNKFVLLAISDTGIGMSKEVLSHLFEPFFTTKPKDKGTGLGLSIVHGIISQIGGFIRPYSKKGVGSTFNIYFPILQDKP